MTRILLATVGIVCLLTTAHANEPVLREATAARVESELEARGPCARVGEPGQFSHPAGLGLGADGSLLVADQGNNRVQKFRLR